MPPSASTPPTPPPPHPGIQLSNTRDTITVLDENGAIIDRVSYEARELPAEGRTKLF